jgi:hypothetical protein
MESKFQFGVRDALKVLGAVAIWFGAVAWLKIPWDTVGRRFVYSGVAICLGVVVGMMLRYLFRRERPNLKLAAYFVFLYMLASPFVYRFVMWFKGEM